MQPRISYKEYLEDINRYRTEFEYTIQDVYNIINDNTNIKQLEARIKSYKSFTNNLYESENELKPKNLDDCFGIKIMLPDDDAIATVIDKLKESGYTIRQMKDHKKKVNTNYNAIHAVLEFKESNIPFEIQLRTPQRAEGRLPHDLYKVKGHRRNVTDADKLKVLEQFIELARMKMSGNYSGVMAEIPIGYKIENEKLTQISSKEVVRNLFPTVEKIMGKELFLNILDKLFFKRSSRKSRSNACKR